MPYCAENFRAFDADGNGKVSEQEFFARPHANPNAEHMFRARDSDGDKVLTETEFCSGWRGGGPGMMHGPGMTRGPGMMGGPMMGRGMGPRPGGPSEGPYCSMGGAMRGTNCDTHFDAFDADGDGKLTREEFAACPQVRGDAEARFSERDRGKDGSVTRDEFCAPWR
jgi:Ca2+-binding EF-hand superfamily protein